MKADILSLKALFQRDIRYVIPTFQRPYVWNQEDQWDPLWNDLRNTAEQYLEELEAVGEDNPAAAEERAGIHFLGAVVLQQQPTATAELETRHVIDGQQRLTTLQLLLDAAQEVFEHGGFHKESRLLRKLVLNDVDSVGPRPEEALKIWPTLVDQDAFVRAMSNGMSTSGYEEAPICQAHEFFKLQIGQWLGEAQEPSLAAHALVTALMGLFQLVVIDLQTKDDANVIFETLNARGTPLLDSDLIKNSILHTADQQRLNSEAMYRQYWEPFDKSWWREEVRQGRLVRPRIDVYLHYWLTMRTVSEVQTDKVFSIFRARYIEKPEKPVSKVVADIHEIGDSFRQLETINDWSPEGSFLYRWHIMDAGVSTPVILWLFSKRREMGEMAFCQAIGAIESFLLRRMACRGTTKDYNRLFLELLARLDSGEASLAPATLLTFLASQTADSRAWPSDEQLREAFVGLPLFQLLTRPRLRMILEALEDSLRSPKSEEEHVRRGYLTIEHIMPQAWHAHWPLHDDDAAAAEERSRLVQTVGNLTLLNDRLNPALSNGPWDAKREGLQAHSVLHLNKQLLSAPLAQWDESLIKTRSAQLAGLASRIWPRPGN